MQCVFAPKNLAAGIALQHFTGNVDHPNSERGARDRADCAKLPAFRLRCHDEIFLRAVREIASWDYAPAQINAWGQGGRATAWAERRPTWIAEAEGSPIGFADLEPEHDVRSPDRSRDRCREAPLQRIKAEAKKHGLKIDSDFQADA